MKRLLLIALSFLLLPGMLRAQQCIPTRGMGDLPFAAGEDLTYALSYNWHAVATDVATGRLSVAAARLDGEPVFHTRMSARTARFFDVFFKVREDFQSWFTQADLQPRKFIRDTHEGSYYAYNLYTYGPGTIHANLDNKSQGQFSKDIPYGPCTFDLPALLYYTRNMDLSQLRSGKTYHLTFAIDDDVYVLTLTFKGRENKYVKGLGTVRSLRFGCSVVAGEMFDGNEDAQLWISDDDNRLPVYFMAPLKVGAVAGRLVSTEGLAHPFAALLSTGKVAQ